jgi:hypothetical protein
LAKQIERYLQRLTPKTLTWQRRVRLRYFDVFLRPSAQARLFLRR